MTTSICVVVIAINILWNYRAVSNGDMYLTADSFELYYCLFVFVVYHISLDMTCFIYSSNMKKCIYHQ